MTGTRRETDVAMSRQQLEMMAQDDGGGSDTSVVTDTRPKTQRPPLYKVLLRYYSENNAVQSRPFPGVIDTLDRLAAMDVKLAVVTNKFESFANEILRQLGLADRCVTLIGGDSLGRDAEGNFRAKPAAAPLHAAIERCNATRLAFVGDSSYDVMAARAAGVPVVAAGYGYCDKPPHELGADAVIDRFDALIPALEAL